MSALPSITSGMTDPTTLQAVSQADTGGGVTADQANFLNQLNQTIAPAQGAVEAANQLVQQYQQRKAAEAQQASQQQALLQTLMGQALNGTSGGNQDTTNLSTGLLANAGSGGGGNALTGIMAALMANSLGGGNSSSGGGNNMMSMLLPMIMMMFMGLLNKNNQGSTDSTGDGSSTNLFQKNLRRQILDQAQSQA